MIKLNSIVLAVAATASVGLMAQAAPIAPIDAALQSQFGLEQVQYRWAGREYCFYDDGWRGPGWYWCGYRLRSGFGWGGPAGWHSWHVEGGPRERGGVGVVERDGRGYGARSGGTAERRGFTEERPGLRTQGRIGAGERGPITGRGEVGARTTTGRNAGNAPSGNLSTGNVPAGRAGAAAPTTTGSGAIGGSAPAGGGRGAGAASGGNRGER